MWRDNFEGLRDIVENPDIDKVFHNAKFDWGMLEALGMEVRGKVWDTGHLCHLLDGRDAEGGLNLESCAEKYLPAQYRKVVGEIEKWFDEHNYPKNKRGRYRYFDDLPHDILKRRVCGDATLTIQLFMRLFPTVQKHFPYLLDTERRLIPIVKRMEDRGVLIDNAEVAVQMEELQRVVDDVSEFCEGVTGEAFNVNSPIHQAELLQIAGIYEQITEVTKPKKDRKSTKPFVPKKKLDAYNLMQLHHPVAAMLLVGKMASKLISPFLTGALEFQVDGVLHASFRQTGTTSGRFSCSDPNLQNIPTEGDRKGNLTEAEGEELADLTGYRLGQHIKRIFQVRPGYCHIHSDKKQAEMVALAHYTGDPNLLDIFARGVSVHDGICALMFPGEEVTKGLKQKSKSVTFGYMYGASIPTLSKKFQGNQMEARAMKHRLESTFRYLPAWNKHLRGQIAARGYVETIHARRHYLKSDEAYMAVNRICQGTVGDEIKRRMVVIGEFLESEKIDARIVLNIHDDLATEVRLEDAPKYGPIIYQLMQESDVAYRLPMPSSMDITYTRWSDLKEIKDPTNPNSYIRPNGVAPISTVAEKDIVHATVPT